MNFSKQDIVKYRFDRATENLEEAKLLTVHEHWNSAGSKLYYACFHAILALLAKQDIKANTHQGVKAMFHQQFIKTNKISKEKGVLYSKLFNIRQEGDYQDFVDFDQQTIEPLIPQVESFIQDVKRLL